MTRLYRHPALGLAGLALAAVVACDARPSPVLRTLGVDAPPDWMVEDCEPMTSTVVFTVPASRYWQCKVPAQRARFEVDWWRGTAVAGERWFVFDDSVRWQRFRDSLATALDAAGATPLPCTRPSERALWYVDTTARAWRLAERERWVHVRAPVYSRLIHWEPMENRWLGGVEIRTGRGAFDACADSLRLLPHRI